MQTILSSSPPFRNVHIALYAVIFFFSAQNIAFGYSSVPYPPEALTGNHTVGQTASCPLPSGSSGSAGSVFYSSGDSFSAISVTVEKRGNPAARSFVLRIFPSTGATTTSPLSGIIASSSPLLGSAMFDNRYATSSADQQYSVFSFPSTVTLPAGFYFIEMRPADGGADVTNYVTWRRISNATTTADHETDFSIRLNNDCSYTNGQLFQNEDIFFTGTTTPVDTNPAEITSISPEYGSTTGSVQLTLSLSFYNNGQYNAAGFRIGNYAPDGYLWLISTTIPATSGFNAVTFPTQTTATGTWQGFAFLQGTGVPDIVENVLFEVVDTGDNFFGAPLPKISASSTAEVQTMCAGASGILGILCKIPDLIQEVIVRAFTPKLSDFQPFIDFKDKIAHKPPFGYITVALDQMQGITASSTPAFTLASEINIQSNVFSPLRDGLSWLLYACGGIWLFGRIRHVEL